MRKTRHSRNIWPRPHAKALDELLTQHRIYVGPIPDDARVLVQKLLSVFHNIGTVSLVLRFVHPSRFGIFSTPVIHLLQIMRPGTVDLYLAYCDELATWCRHFGQASVAQTETALWTFAEFVKQSDSDFEAAKASRDFDDDMGTARESSPGYSAIFPPLWQTAACTDFAGRGSHCRWQDCGRGI